MAQYAVLTVHDLLLEGRSRLVSAGADTPWLDSEVLLCQALAISRTHLLASLPNTVSDASARVFHELLERRVLREPLAYITGTKEFWHRGFKVAPGVLIPRPESELLVERALAMVNGQRVRIADVGTGSGCLAITLALESPSSSVLGIDNSSEALRIARENARLLEVGSNLEVVYGDLLGNVDGPLDIVIANLPYVCSDEIETLQPEIRRWEPREALDGGPDGLDVVRRLLWQVSKRAFETKRVLLEIDPRQFDMLLCETRVLLPGYDIRGHYDLAGLLRVAEIFMPSS